MLSVTYSNFKTLVAQQNLPISYTLNSVGYLLQATDDTRQMETFVYTGSADYTDFVTNYLSTSNIDPRGQKTMANSNPVVIASDQSPLLVTNAPTLPTISTGNSTTSTLTSGSGFTGTAEDVSSYAQIDVTISSDQNSAANGLVFEFSQDGTAWYIVDGLFTLRGAIPAFYPITPAGKYFRIQYTNGAINQTAFRLVTTYYSAPRAPLTSALDYPIPFYQIAPYSKSILAARDASTGTYVNTASTADGRLMADVTIASLAQPQKITVTPANTGTICGPAAFNNVSSVFLCFNTTSTITTPQACTVEISPSLTDNVWLYAGTTLTPDSTTGVVVGTAFAGVGLRFRVRIAAAIDTGSFDLYVS